MLFPPAWMIMFLMKESSLIVKIVLGKSLIFAPGIHQVNDSEYCSILVACMSLMMEDPIIRRW